MKNIPHKVNDKTQNGCSKFSFYWTLQLFLFLETLWLGHHIRAVWSHDLSNQWKLSTSVISLDQCFLKNIAVISFWNCTSDSIQCFLSLVTEVLQITIFPMLFTLLINLTPFSTIAPRLTSLLYSVHSLHCFGYLVNFLLHFTISTSVNV